MDKRFELLQPLGQGGQGRVYLVRDHSRRGIVVALKRLKDDREQKGNLALEFDRLSTIRHPNLARAYDFGEDDEGAYFTSEYVEGIPFLSFAEQASQQQVVEALGALLRALAILHDRELVHGDVTPENVLVVPQNNDGTSLVKLLDLGGACRPGQHGSGMTAGFAAPEILTGRGALPVSDLYAFGALTAKALLGVSPFGEESASKVVTRQLNGNITLPEGELSPIAALCRQLLQVDPAKRPRNAEEALKQLAEAADMNLALTLESVSPSDLPEPRRIGREQSLAALLGLIDQLETAAEIPVAAVVGQKGAGKSTLLAEAARFAQLSGFGVIGEVGAAGESHHLLYALTHAGGAADLSPEAEKALAPWMESNWTAPVSPSTAWCASVVFAALEALETACREKPHLIIVDDLFEQDKLTREVVAALCRALSPDQDLRSAAAMIIAFDETARDQWTSSIGPEITLPPLDSGQTAQLVASMLPGITAPESFTDAIFLASGGIPGRAVESVRSAVGGGTEMLAATVKTKVEALDKESRAIIAVMGSIGAPLPEAVLSAALVDRHKIDALIQNGFCFEVGAPGAICLQAAEVAGETAPTLTAEEAFVSTAARLLTALEADNHLALSARLRHEIGDPKGAADTYRTLAEQRAGMGDFSGAGEWFEKAMGEDDGSFDIAELARAAMETWHAIGWSAQALSALPKAALKPEDERLLRAELTMADGRHREAIDILSQGEPGSRFHEWQAKRAACEMQLGRHESALALVEELVEADAERPLSPILSELAQIGGLACTYLAQREQAQRFFEMARQGFEAASNQLGQLKVSANMGMLERLRGNLAEARAAYETAVDIAKAIGDRPREGLHLMNRATVSQVACNYRSAYEDYRKALEIATVLGNDFRMTQAEVNFADLLLDMGQVYIASKMILRALDRCRTLSQERLEVRALLTAGRGAMLAGDYLRAERRLEEAKRRFAAAGDEAGTVSACQHLAELKLERGMAAQASELAQRAAKVSEKSGRLREISRSHLLLGRCAMHSGGDLRAALVHLETAEQALKKRPAPDFLWRIALFRHRILKKQGRSEAAQKALLQAQSVFDTLLDRVPDQFKQSFIEIAGAEELTRSVLPEGDTSDRWSRDLEMLMEINRELTRERDPKRLLSLIMVSAVELTGAERGMLVMPKGSELVPVITHQLSDEAEKRFSRSVAEKVVAEDRVVLAVDALDDARFRAFVSVNAMKLRSILAVPLRIKRRVVGVIYLDSRLRTGVFTDADRRLLEAFGAQAAICLETARLISENEQHVEELQAANAEISALSIRLKERLENREAKLKRVGALLEKTQSDEAVKLKKSGMIGRSQAMQQVRKLIDRIALADVPVYVFGASGTGKELAAKAIHAASERSKHPFVPINCGALPPKLLASELFGHKKGAFTGAIGNRPGLFKLADKGTLFLDEVSDMDKEMQTHLLRVLQDGTFRSLGDSEEISVDVRIISASNRDLEQEVALGTFREDLFYRLNVVRVDLPPLSERREDIPLLVEFLAKRHLKADKAPRFTKEVINLLMGAEWPGNVRELENEVLRAITMAGDNEVIEVMDLSPRFTQGGMADAWSSQGNLKDRVTHFEGVLISQTIAACGGNATRAAKALGVSRATLYKKMEKCGISPS